METITRNLEELTAFHVVALTKSFTAAATDLGCSKAMVSKQIRRLETYVKAQLFYRTTRALSLTAAGEALFSYSQRIFELSEEASKHLQDLSQGTSGLVRISAPVSLGEIIFPELAEQLRGQLPNVQYEFDLSNDSRDLMSGQIDFALRAKENHHPDLVARYLGRIKDVICASPEYLAKNKISEHPRDLASHSCLLHSHVKSWNSWTLTGNSDDIRVEAKGRLSSNQYPMIRLLCLKGNGIAKIPFYLVQRDLEEGKLISLFPNYSVATHPLFLIYLRNQYSSPKHKLTKQAILDWFSRNSDLFVLERPASGNSFAKGTRPGVRNKGKRLS